MPAFNARDERRFWSKVERLPGRHCWLWTGYRDKRAYGRFQMRGQVVLSHRVAFYLATGNDPGDLLVCHKCDNPPCCNPQHLFLGTMTDNIRDAARKGRLMDDPKPYVGSHVGELNPQAKLAESDVRQIIASWNSGVTQLQLAQTFGVTKGAIAEITNGNNWAHLGLPIEHRDWKTKISPDGRRAVIEARRNGLASREIAHIFGLSRSHVDRILRGWSPKGGA